MRTPRAAKPALLSLVLAGLLLLGPGAPRAGSAAPYATETSISLGHGVTWEQLTSSSPQLSIQVAHVAPGAGVRIVPVLSNDHVYENPPQRRTELTSSMCRRASGLVCVNADFTQCAGCGEPFGAFVIDGVPLRSPSIFHEQVSVLTDGGLSSDRLKLDLRLVGVFEPDNDLVDELLDPEERREVTLEIDQLNRPVANGVALYSPAWATTTQTPSGTVETLFEGAVPAIGAASPVTIGDTGSENSRIPRDGFVLAASGSARDESSSTISELRGADSVELRISANLPVSMSVGGHPVILRNGERVAHDSGDGKVSNRHPRTLIGWNEAGDVWLVAVDGRRKGHSVGMTMAEAADHLLHLGATDALNLDGGGSTTFVTSRECPDGGSPCIRNRPSDGSERNVSSALALVAVGGTSTEPAPPPPEPPPPGPRPAPLPPAPESSTGSEAPVAPPSTAEVGPQPEPVVDEASINASAPTEEPTGAEATAPENPTTTAETTVPVREDPFPTELSLDIEDDPYDPGSRARAASIALLSIVVVASGLRRVNGPLQRRRTG